MDKRVYKTRYDLFLLCVTLRPLYPLGLGMLKYKRRTEQDPGLNPRVLPQLLGKLLECTWKVRRHVIIQTHRRTPRR